MVNDTHTRRRRLELYVNRNCQIGVHVQEPQGHVPQCPRAGNANEDADSTVVEMSAVMDELCFVHRPQ